MANREKMNDVTRGLKYLPMNTVEFLEEIKRRVARRCGFH